MSSIHKEILKKTLGTFEGFLFGRVFESLSIEELFFGVKDPLYRIVFEVLLYIEERIQFVFSIKTNFGRFYLFRRLVKDLLSIEDPANNFALFKTRCRFSLFTKTC